MANNHGRPSVAGSGRKSSVGKGLLVVTQHRLSVQGTQYRKDLEFPADGPGRVIVRLERLMGSDRIRITDTKYMATLLQRLQEEEEITWQKRTRERRKAEHNRFRQLVIDGYTEPTPAMEDLYNHPVFRVNRILNRLARLNNAITPTTNLPPIIPVDPFEFDDTGRVFKSYPGHFPVEKERSNAGNVIAYMEPRFGYDEDIGGYNNAIPEEMTLNVEQYENRQNYEEEGDEDGDTKGEFYSKLLQPKHPGHIIRPSAASVERITGHKVSDPSIEKTAGHITFSTSPVELRKMSRSHSKVENKSNINEDIDTEPERLKVLTLHEIQKKYRVAPNTDLGVQWKPYQPSIVQMIYHDEKKGVSDLYEMGAEIANMFDRQQQTADDFIATLYKEKEKLHNERSIENNEDREDEEVLEDINDESDDFHAISEIGEYHYEEQEKLGEAEVPLESFEERNVVSPTWDILQDLWEE